MVEAGGWVMNVIRNIYEVRFTNTYILLHIIYYILPLTVIIVMTINVVGLLQARQTLSKLLRQGSWDSWDDLKNHKSVELVSRFKYV